MFIITRSAPNCEYEWEYTSEIFYSEFLGVPIIVSNMFLRNFNYDPPPKFLLSNERLDSAFF